MEIMMVDVFSKGSRRAIVQLVIALIVLSSCCGGVLPLDSSKSFRTEPWTWTTDAEPRGLGAAGHGRRSSSAVVSHVEGEGDRRLDEQVKQKYAVKATRIEGRCESEECRELGSSNCGSCTSFNVFASNTTSSPDAQVLLAWSSGMNDGISNVLANWNLSIEPDFCRWKGVTCDNSSTVTHVVAINLAGGKVGGSIASGLSALEFLTKLDLSFNHLSGDIPADLANITPLEILNLKSNKLTGNIPPFGKNNTRLQSVNLWRNRLDGGIPPSLSECPQLTYLNFALNRLSGDIPAGLGSLPNLQNLYLEQNKLNGPLPSSLGNCKALINLNVGWNQLWGTVPDEYSNLTVLQGLYLYGNNFAGTLPAWLAELPSLEYLHLYYNRFSGKIPELLGKNGQLISINLSNNTLTGSMPTALVQSSKTLIEIDFSVNLLTDTISSDIGLLTGLQAFRAEQNNLTGSIPPSLSSCVNMTMIILSSNQLSGPILDLSGFPQLLRLSLDHNAFTGSIPSSLSTLANLSTLELSYNDLSGSIPSDIGLLTNLSYLGLSDNSLYGTVPDLSGLTQLTFLNLEHNLLSGSISPTLGNLLQLQTLALGSNHLTGIIPPELSGCVNLTTLTLDHNRLNGIIPPSFAQLVALTVLNLQGNTLSGNVPPTFNNLSKIRDFVLSENLLTGGIPVSLLTRVSQIQGRFSLANNRLSGSLPKELGLLTMVQVLDLSGNDFSKGIPDEIGNCTALVELDLAANALTGVIPSSVERLSSLQSLNLSHNALNGSIPEAIGTLAQLQQLDLANNNLSGGLTSLSNMSSLTFLNVSNNNLEGPIPTGGAFRNFSASSFMGNPGLCGQVLQKNCDTSGHHGRRLPPGAIFGIVFGSAALLAMIVALVFLWWRLSRWGQPPQKRGSIIARSELFYPQLRFTVQDLKLATENFSEINILGTGSLSSVYRGVLPELVLVAVKKLKVVDGTEIPPTFVEELDELGKLRHRHLVAILGHSFATDINALVVQFMSNGSLEEHLHRRQSSALDWPARAKVGLGVAKALTYLHHDCGSVIVHCDLKPSNILLDADFEPHLEDFGLSRLIFANKLMEMTQATVGTSMGYFPPEYGFSPTVSTKGDVYSFGIVLLELLTGKKPMIDMFKRDMTITKWCQASYPHKIADVLDPTLLGSKETNVKQVGLFMKVALMCTREAPEERPTMKNALDMLR